ncbi:MAG: hypothetical protein LBU32_25685 [Clostridiales bacterium]|jgi:hypothetical protein|nr:hypothetical protein [Clostridiales bacterium]
MYFKKVSSLEDLKQQYRSLAMQHHPDRGGSSDAMKAVNGEYDVLFPIWQKKHNQVAEVRNTETARSTRSEFYTQNGWKGKNYDSILSTIDIAKLIRQYVKQAYPLHKFSVTRQYFAGGSSIHVALMEAPHPVFAEGKSPRDDHVQNAPAYFEPGRWAFGDEPRCVLTEQAVTVLQDVQAFINSYNYDDRDSMIDYFSTNFYSRLDIGKWDKPFKVVEKTPRVAAMSLTNRGRQYAGKRRPVRDLPNQAGR